MVEWEDLIGTPFQYGARPGSGFLDCYGLVIELHNRQGIQVPSEPWSDNAKVISTMMNLGAIKWVKCETPAAGRVALLKVNGVSSHVGYCLNDEDFLHTWEASGGVIKDRLSRWKHRIASYYEYRP